MSHYEMMVILRPDLSEDQVNQEVSKYQDFLGQQGCQEITVKVWGKRRLAYTIDRFVDGIYVLFNYQGDGKQVAPLERAMRLSEEVIRFLTLKLPTPKPEDESVAEAVPVEA